MPVAQVLPGEGDDPRQLRLRHRDALGARQAVAHGFEHRQRRFQGQLLHANGLETALQRGITFNIQAILLIRGGGDAGYLAARQRGFHDIRQVAAAAPAGARAHQRVRFVEEEDDIAGTGLAQQRQHAAFHVAHQPATGDDGGGGEQHDARAAQRRRYHTRRHPLGQPLDDRRFAHARRAQQRGVPLRASAERFDDALDFRIAPENRPQPPFARCSR
ncbi:MAG: hypothetical protein BWY76_00560 [bacterium ADurb.Bin429]|nr:MAG: hypothetical protein BWY76_00560 [bacterium ADurb.Bin429]